MITYNNRPVIFGKFPNGEINLPKIRLDPLDTTHVVSWKYESDAELFRLMLVRESLHFPVTLRVTYFPYSRMDRENNEYAFSLRTLATLINFMGWERVIIYEPHSDVLPALIDRVQVVDVTTSFKMLSTVNIAVNAPYQVCYPDVGAFKRYSEKLKTPDPLVGFKVRDFETGRIKELTINGNRNLDNVVIFDDLCSKGGTFILAAEQLYTMGFKRIFLAVAHCEQTIFEGEVFSSGLIEKVITTDSILGIPRDASDKLQIIPLTSFKWT